ncbi:MAG: class I SAM-dependent methyltransferase [Promethearchaeota archaeon]
MNPDEKKKRNEFLAVNKLRWNDVVSEHAKSKYYNVDGFKKGKSSLTPLELEDLPDLHGKKVLHLMCHFGMDTLSLARLGAEVTGIDFSETAIEYARNLADELKIPAKFVQADIYDLPNVLDAKEQFDIVFTSWGVLTWLPDLLEWAKVITHFLKPGGQFFIFEIHPFMAMIGETNDNKIEIQYSYSTSESEPLLIDEIGSYTDEGERHTPFTHTKRYEWEHPIGEIITSLASAGLKIEKMKEYPKAIFQMLSDMKPLGNGLYQYGNDDIQIPFTFSIKAIKL